MITLVCFDTQTGTLRRYAKRIRDVVCTGKAQFDPWQQIPPERRVVSAESVEAFRVHQQPADAPRAA